MPQDNDRQNLTFSQRHGYEEIPPPLGKLNKKARTQILNIFDDVFCGYPSNMGIRFHILEKILTEQLDYPKSQVAWNDPENLDEYEKHVMNDEFNKVFDVLEYIMQHEDCPKEFIHLLKEKFSELHLPYIIEDKYPYPPKIHPATTETEGESLLQSIHEMHEAGLTGAEEHLKQASNCIHQNDWKGAIRESIHAVESVARQLAPKGAKSLKSALLSLDKQNSLHPALKEGMLKLYGYASDEQGIRHALLDRDGTYVGPDEALYMLGSCASFASYLGRKYKPK